MEEQIEKTEYTFEVMYKFMVRTDDFISSQDIMDECKLSKTQFYNALDQLRKLNLIEVRVDMNDFRKKYYRATKRKDNIF